MLRKKTTKLKSKPKPLHAQRKRRSLSNIPPPPNHSTTLLDPRLLRNDLDKIGTKVQIIPRPTRRKDRCPYVDMCALIALRTKSNLFVFFSRTYQRFLQGHSSLWSVVKAISKLEQHQRDVNARLSQTFDGGWFSKDQKDHVKQQNKENALQAALPKQLCVHLRICRTQVVALLDDRFDAVRFADMPHIFIFFKTSTPATTTMPIETRTSKVTLQNSTVLIWVGGHAMQGITQNGGLGTLYTSNGRDVSGRAQLLLRVANRQKKPSKKHRRRNGTIEQVW